VLAAFMAAVLITVALGGLKIGSAVVARHRAQSAADLAALAAAAKVPDGPAAACREAATVAGAMRASVRECAVDQLDVNVVVTVVVGGWTGAQAGAAARAGPAAPAQTSG
jgi:secretion/DNA translocation related TadE-like protein